MNGTTGTSVETIIADRMDRMNEINIKHHNAFKENSVIKFADNHMEILSKLALVLMAGMVMFGTFVLNTTQSMLGIFGGLFMTMIPATLFVIYFCMDNILGRSNRVSRFITRRVNMHKDR